MSLSRKIVVILAVPLLFELIFLVGLIGADRRSARYRLWQSRSTEAIFDTNHVLHLMVEAETGTRGYVATGKPVFLEPYNTALHALRTNFPLLEDASRLQADGVTSRVPDQHQVRDLDRAATVVLDDLREDIDLVRAGRQPEALARLGAEKAVMDRFRAELGAFLDEELAVQREQKAELARVETTMRVVIIGLLVANLAITFVFVWFLTRSVACRIRRIVENMARMAAGKELLSPLASGDEIGRVDSGFHEMAERLRAAHEELRHEKEDLRRLNEEKNRFMGMAAHDLRNPLFGVLTLTEVLMRRGSLSEADQKLLRQIARSTTSMRTLVDDFLDVSAIEAGELRLRRERVDLGSVVEDCVALQQPLAAQKNIDIHFEKDGHAAVLADADKIGQVMANLITNALKFSPENGIVDVSLIASKSVVRVSVSDRGSGISPQETELLFQPFSMASTRATAGESRTGLGLAICRKIVEGHGGRIWVESNAGHGSVFSFELERLNDLRAQTADGDLARLGSLVGAPS
jgi:signal transduction histidine kinase